MSEWWKENVRKSAAQRRLEEYELEDKNWAADGIDLVCADCRAIWYPGRYILEVQHGSDCHITEHRKQVRRELLAAVEGEGEG